MDYAGKCLTLIGAASIQDYIFRSNDLKDNVGASQIVYSELRYLYNHPPQGCTPIYAGGGNAALLFDSQEDAKLAIQHWTFRIARDFPGLRVAVAHQPVRRHLRSAWNETREKLSESENRPPFGSELGALPFVKVCATTGLAAAGTDYGEPISAESKAKRAKREDFDRRLKECILKPAVAETFSIPKDFGKIGEEGASQIALVHADGNNIGKAFKSCSEEAKSDDEFLDGIGDLSNKLTQTETRALQNTVADLTLAGVLNWLSSTKLIDREQNNYVLPLRPIVFGGDDVTFVCHGKLGLSLATRYIRHFEEASRESFGDKTFTCCAGVLVMPQKFPFSRAYRLAEHLCANAKHRRREQGGTGSWIDFQLLLEGASGSLEGLRRILYGENFENLLGRPYKIDGDDSRSWTFFERAYRHLTGGSHRWPRSRIKQMLESIAAGTGEDAALEQAFAARGYDLPAGMSAKNCFDAFEMADFHIEIAPELTVPAGAA